MMRWQRIFAVAKFEFFAVTKRWSYLLTTFGLPAFLVFMSAGVFGAQSLFLAERAAERKEFGLVDEAGVLSRGADLESESIVFKWLDSRQAAIDAVRKGELGSAYVVAADYMKTGDVHVLQSSAGLSLSVQSSAVQPVLRRLLRRSLLSDQVETGVAERVVNPAFFVRMTVGESEVSAPSVDQLLELAVRSLIPVMLGVLLLTALLSASGYLVQTIATDKETRIVEVLLAAVSPEEILSGKLLGLGLAGLIQFAVWSSMVVFGALAASALLSTMIELPWLALVIAPPFFVLGYLFIGSLMLATASLGINAAESQKLTIGWVLLALLPLMAMVVLLESPHGVLGQAFTWIPFTSPLTVIIRLAVQPEGIAMWEVVGAVAALVLSTWLAIRIGGRLFRVGFLLTGSRPSWRELLRQARRLR